LLWPTRDPLGDISVIGIQDNINALMCFAHIHLKENTTAPQVLQLQKEQESWEVQPLTDILVLGIQGNISALTYVAHISSMATKIAQLVLLLQTVEEYLEV